MADLLSQMGFRKLNFEKIECFYKPVNWFRAIAD